MSHEAKRKEIQIKELQGRLDTGDGCKYTSIDNTKSKKDNSNICRSYFLGNKIISAVFIQTVAFHAVYIALKHFNLFDRIISKK